MTRHIGIVRIGVVARQACWLLRADGVGILQPEGPGENQIFGRHKCTI